MKKLIVLTILMTGFMTFGQEKHKGKRAHHRKGKMEIMKDLSPEQMAVLKTKRMTLDLDLNNSQQDKIYALNLETAKNRKYKIEARKKAKDEKNKLSSDEKYNRLNTRLDEEIALKNKMKLILTKEQFNKWEQNRENLRINKKKAIMRS
jgi:hypothetical protein